MGCDAILLLFRLSQRAQLFANGPSEVSVELTCAFNPRFTLDLTFILTFAPLPQSSPHYHYSHFPVLRTLLPPTRVDFICRTFITQCLIVWPSPRCVDRDVVPLI